jgi:hypothetical protein
MRSASSVAMNGSSIDIGQSRIGAGRGWIDLSRALHAQSFVRTFVIEDFDEIIEERACC